MSTIVIFLLVFILIMAVAFQNSADLWRKAFSNDDGAPSSNRVFLAFLLLTLVTWADKIVQKTGIIPEVPDTWLYLIFAFSGIVIGTKAIKAFGKEAGNAVSTGSAGPQA